MAATSKTKQVLFEILRRRHLLSNPPIASVSHLTFIPPSPSAHPFLHPPASYSLAPSTSRSYSTSHYGGGGEDILQDSCFPVRAIISMLDGFHDFTGVPWWVTIGTSTVVMRVALLPVLILQLQKMKQIEELFPKLPPPFPPPLSGRSFKEQFLHFGEQRRAIGCPSFLWMLASFSTQVPCFLLWVTSIRRMSLNHHPGFDSGGTLWFQDLTEYPHGALGIIFPLLIASLHYINVQISFRSSLRKVEGVFGQLARYYKIYLDLLTPALFFVGFNIPQGSLVYWVINSSFSVIQQLALKQPAVCAKLGLPSLGALDKVENSGNSKTKELASVELSSNRKIAIEDLTPKELFALSVKRLSERHTDAAISLLKFALNKDPDYVKAIVLVGQAMLQKGQLSEAVEYLEHAVSKLMVKGHPAAVEDVDLLILSSQWAGAVYLRQGKTAEGLAHLERIGNLEEPEDPRSKAHYFDGLLLLSSGLVHVGRKAEAEKFLRSLVAYNPEYSYLLEQLDEDDNFDSHVAKSRRKDY